MSTDGVRRLDVVGTPFHPAYVVWELTLRCDHACTHCGSRASGARESELTTAEALRVAGELADLGAREVVLIGGEAYLHDGFLDVARALTARGVSTVMTTGGLGIDATLAAAMADAGIRRTSVSIDGLAPTHDRMRARQGSFAGALRALAALRDAGIVPMTNTNLNRFNAPDLEALYEVLRDAGIRAWQVQLTAPLGRAADRPDMLLQPFDLLDLVPRIAALKKRGLRDGVMLMPGNNLGYFGPEEGLLRSLVKDGPPDHWHGCQAGRFVMGIESDGAVKGCPSLQTTHYVGGNARERPIAAIWQDAPELAFTRQRTVESLWGYCRECAYAEDCLGGCSFTAHSFFGRPGNNPYCHHRAREMKKAGLRERLVATEPATGLPFDNGLFDLVVEPFEAADPGATVPREELVRIGRKPRKPRSPPYPRTD